MSWQTGLAIYFVIWWLALFLVLPFGARAPIDGEDVLKGQDPGAPRRPRLLVKGAITTVLAAVIFAIFYIVYESGAVSFRPS